MTILFWRMGHGPEQKTTTEGLTTMRRLSEWLPEEKLKGTVSRIPSRYASGTLWPHGEWSLGWASEREDGGGNDGAAWYVPDSVVEREFTPGWAEGLHLDLSDTSNSTNRPRRGGKGITGYGQQMVKACGYLMQEKWPQHRKTLGTVTLPDMSPEARAEVVQAWPDLTRELLRWLSRRLERQGLPPVVCSVTEIQPKRLAESGEGYLHWHLLWINLPGRKGNWAVDPCDVRAWLGDLLQRHCPSYQGGYLNVDTKPVDGRVAAYLAKYMSKGKQQVAEAVEDWGEDNTPRTWWNMTAQARAMVKAATRKGREIGTVLEECMEHGWRIGPDEVFAFLAPITFDFDGRLAIVGWRGRFDPDVFRALTMVLESLHMQGLAEES